MKKFRKLVLLLVLAGPAAVNLSCSSVLLRDVRDGFVGAVSSFTQQTVLDVLGTFTGNL